MLKKIKLLLILQILILNNLYGDNCKDCQGKIYNENMYIKKICWPWSDCSILQRNQIENDVNKKCESVCKNN